MLKKFFHLIRFLLIGTIWTLVFLVLSSLIMYQVWNFDIFNFGDWQTIERFWNSGGTIKIAKDYAFIGSIILIPILWIWILYKLNKINWLDIILAPVHSYNAWIIRCYGSDSKRIVLKNIKSSQDNIEFIKQQLESIKPEKPREVVNIREEIQKKIESETTKY